MNIIYIYEFECQLCFKRMVYPRREHQFCKNCDCKILKLIKILNENDQVSEREAS